MQNGHIESFHDKLRVECLKRELFGNLREARAILESWRVEYNECRSHSALGYRTPNEYAESKTNGFDGGCAPPNPAPLAAAGGGTQDQRHKVATTQTKTKTLRNPQNFSYEVSHLRGHASFCGETFSNLATAGTRSDQLCRYRRRSNKTSRVAVERAELGDCKLRCWAHILSDCQTKSILWN